jgi:hypothetical protein
MLPRTTSAEVTSCESSLQPIGTDLFSLGGSATSSGSGERVATEQDLPPTLLPVRREPGSARWHLAVDDIVNTGGLTLEHVVSGLLGHGAGGNGLVEVRL